MDNSPIFHTSCLAAALPRLQLQDLSRARERYGLIWIFPGDAGRLADATPMPEIPELEAPMRWACIPLEFEWQAHHSIIIDNLSDLTHGHLHRRYKPFADPVLERPTRLQRRRGPLPPPREPRCHGAFMKRLHRRTRADMEAMELCFQYPYQWGNTGGRVKHWVFLMPLDNATTKVFFMFYFNQVKVPFTRLHFPQRLMGAVLRVFNPIFIKPVVSQDGDAVAWEQAGYDATSWPGAWSSLNPAVVGMFQEARSCGSGAITSAPARRRPSRRRGIDRRRRLE